ncbi:MAG TPA: undecaprenyl-phosphate glucose phosphotransferase [Rhodocyclaceae bacterium]|nr:undecaprenyl-phosphate glucose phosphotransferase [Rhodocyclaceae bacterium]
MTSTDIGSRKVGNLGAPRQFAGMERAGTAMFQLAESLVEPATVLLTLVGLTLWFEHGGDRAYYIVVAVLLFALTFPGKRFSQRSAKEIVRDVVLGWAGLMALVLAFGFATGFIYSFPPNLVAHWLWLAPVAQIAGHLSFRAFATTFVRTRLGYKRAVIVGCNEQGRQLAQEIAAHPMLGQRVSGYFDDREVLRVEAGNELVLGKLEDVAEYVKRYDVQVIYLALPMASQQRILALLDSLRDTTASIYFVPDVFVTDLIQARMDAVGRMPVVAVCDTPFSGLNGAIKRGSDIVLSLFILVLISPLLLVVGALVRATSPGPAIFKQRRYGLDGKEIMVYKFRSMRVCQDGAEVPQATREDPRVTPVGRFIRKTSIDELPQFLNVLQGRMSIVGPRPHAVAHNEMYRKLIKGYMVRHKVKPGITGWAQVNGCRGETETLDKMQARIDLDLEYLRHWSLRLDLYIIARTVILVFKDASAY